MSVFFFPSFFLSFWLYFGIVVIVTQMHEHAGNNYDIFNIYTARIKRNSKCLTTISINQRKNNEKGKTNIAEPINWSSNKIFALGDVHVHFYVWANERVSVCTSHTRSSIWINIRSNISTTWHLFGKERGRKQAERMLIHDVAVGLSSIHIFFTLFPISSACRIFVVIPWCSNARNSVFKTMHNVIPSSKSGSLTICYSNRRAKIEMNTKTKLKNEQRRRKQSETKLRWE